MRSSSVVQTAEPMTDLDESQFVDFDDIQPESSDVDAQIKAAVAAAMEQYVKSQPVSRFIEPENHAPPVVAPPSYKKHYRCDTFPKLKIAEMDMSVLAHGGRPQSYPLETWIQFNRGHLYTNNDNVIAQMEYMMNTPQYGADGSSTVGGNPAIYEDDGTDVFRCPQGCEFYTASKASFQAHMRSTHGVSING